MAQTLPQTTHGPSQVSHVRSSFVISQYPTPHSMKQLHSTGKGKVHPRTGHRSPEGEQRFSHNLSLTSALDVGGWSTPRPDRFTLGKDPVSIV